MAGLKVLVAPNAFKNAATATEAAAAISAGLSKSPLQADITVQPIADGGDGTLDIIVHALGGEIFKKEVSGPLGKMVTAPLGYVRQQGIAVIEMADASGLKLLKSDERDVMGASSAGTGELIAEAIRLGAGQIILCIGGSATVDGGTGILSALGYRFKGKSGHLLKASGASLTQIAEVIPPATGMEVKLTVLCDVSNPLLGPTGAAAVYGPQKGASPQQVTQLEQGLTNWASLISQYKGVDVTKMTGGGAAGGVSAGLVGWLGAELTPGAGYILNLMGMEQAVKDADMVITAEGSLDEQTTEGKAPFALLQLARKYNKPVVGLAGRVPGLAPDSKLREFDALLPIGSEPEDLDSAMANTVSNLERTALNLGSLLALGARLKT